MTEVRCFWLEPTGKTRLSLRRYISSSDEARACASARSYCDAQREIATIEGDGGRTPPPRDDARWPTACSACGRAFTEDDAWQVFPEGLFRRADTGEELTIREAPAGAMWDAAWMHLKGADGRALMVRTPGGFDWFVDGPATNGPGWTRSGEPPNVTARPSIGVPDHRGAFAYHGFLTDGVLRSC